MCVLRCPLGRSAAARGGWTRAIDTVLLVRSRRAQAKLHAACVPLRRVGRDTVGWRVSVIRFVFVLLWRVVRDSLIARHSGSAVRSVWLNDAEPCVCLTRAVVRRAGANKVRASAEHVIGGSFQPGARERLEAWALRTAAWSAELLGRYVLRACYDFVLRM